MFAPARGPGITPNARKLLVVQNPCTVRFPYNPTITAAEVW
jgi:hypothetical protein